MYTEEGVSASEGGSKRRLGGLNDLYSSTNIIRVIKTKWCLRNVGSGQLSDATSEPKITEFVGYI
jgi:hypothetical protein